MASKPTPAKKPSRRAGQAKTPPKDTGVGTEGKRLVGADMKPRYRETRGQDWLITTINVAMFVGFVIVAVLVVRPRYGGFVTFLLILAMLWVLVGWHNRSYGYRCARCGYTFQIRRFENFVTPQGVGKRADGTYYGYKWLQCPKCGQRTRAEVLKRGDLRRGSGELLRPRDRT